MKTNALILFFVSYFLLNTTAQSQEVTVFINEIAEVTLNGQSMGDRNSVTFKLTKKQPSVTIVAKKKGWITVERTYSRNFGKPPKNDAIKLERDEAFVNSLEVDYVNKRSNIETKLKFDEAWRYFAMIIRNYIEEFKVSDKATGHMETQWKITKYDHCKVRQRVIVSQTSTNPLIFSVKLQSEISTGYRDNYKPWNRIMKNQEGLISELQTRLGSK